MSNSNTPSPDVSGSQSPFWKQIGPSLITAAVVIGPGTITVSSKIGAGMGMSMVWVLLVAGAFMMTYTAMAAKIGVLGGEPVLHIVRRRYGGILAVTLGILSFAVAAGFQSSNYIACATALHALTGVGMNWWMALVGLAGLTFVFAARNLYKVLERVMMGLVGAMLIAFLINLIIARPQISPLLSGLKPSSWPEGQTDLLIALNATTFSVIAALYQASLAWQKGWKGTHWKTAMRESFVGISVLVGVSLMVMWTSATVLSGKQILGAADLAEQLRPSLGPIAVWVFGLGFLSAGFSSVVVNAMIGGGLLADGLGKDGRMGSSTARLWTVAAMGVGMVAGIFLTSRNSAIPGIVIAQKSTILSVPLAAAVILMLANDAKVVGKHRNRWSTNLLGGLGLAALLVMSGRKLLDLFQ